MSAVETPTSIVDAMFTKKFFGRHFKEWESWRNWATVLKTIYALPFTLDGEQEIFEKISGRKAPLTVPYDEIFIIAGRRAGKSTIASLIAIYEALYGGWEKHQDHGEPWQIFIIADTLAQGRICHGNVKRFLHLHSTEVEKIAGDDIVLKNGCTITAKASDFRSIRGFNLALAVLDEVGFFPGDSAGQIINALTPSLMTGGKLVGISSTGPRTGTLHEISRKNFANENASVLVLKASSLLLNPTISEKKIKADIARDSRMAKEYFPEVGDEDEGLFEKDALESIATYATEGRKKGLTYCGFIDASAGMADSMTMAVAHAEDERVYLDLVLEKVPPFDFVAVCDEFADILSRYGIVEPVADRYAFAATESLLRRRHISLNLSKVSATDLFMKMLSLVRSDAVRLVSDKTLLAQLAGLERYATSKGERISAPEREKDDVAVAAAGAIYGVCKAMTMREPTPGIIKMAHEHPDPIKRCEQRLYKDMEECEVAFRESLERDFGGVCIPLKSGKIPMEK
jgi:hypothetical protein